MTEQEKKNDTNTPTNQVDETYGDVVFQNTDVSKINLFTIPAGINLYYGSQSRTTFDPMDIKLSDGTLLALFSNNPRLASDVFMNCANYPSTTGNLHKFVTTTNIPYIQIISASSIVSENTLSALDLRFCQRASNPKLNGFAYTVKSSIKNDAVDYIIGLCNPNQFLKYDSTSFCVNPYHLGKMSNIFQ
jgi:hypothetical protein